MTTFWLTTGVANGREVAPLSRSGKGMNTVLALRKPAVRVAEARIGAAEASSAPNAAASRIAEPSICPATTARAWSSLTIFGMKFLQEGPLAGDGYCALRVSAGFRGGKFIVAIVSN